MVENRTDKQVLFIAHDFPPSGGPGVQRSAKFVKYLPDFGWQPIVLTTRYPMWRVTDETLINDIPSDTVIVRTHTAEPRTDSSKLHHLFFAFPNLPPWLPDESMAWLPWAASAALREIRRRPIKMIYATGGPFSTHILGALLKSITGLPLVIDFRDEWVLDPAFMQGRGSQRQWLFFLDHALQDWVVHKADKVILVSDHARDVFGRRYGLSDKFTTIRNGYDPDDFATAVEPHLPPDQFHIASVGSPSLRESRPEIFFKGLQQAVDSDETFRKHVKVYFVGAEDAQSKLFCTESGVDSYVDFLGYHSHPRSVGFLKRVDVLLLIFRQFLYKGDDKISCRVPGKLYEYVGAGRPVLALAPKDSEAFELIERAGTAFWANPEDPMDIARKLIELETLWRCGELKANVDDNFLKTLTRKHLTGCLAQVLDEISR